ncbi:MAG: TldD/PmbA family protein [Cyanobacteriota bacterium]|nr:TldD/PmbA family protein [Cyanobacteriota bacterium]
MLSHSYRQVKGKKSVRRRGVIAPESARMPDELLFIFPSFTVDLEHVLALAEQAGASHAEVFYSAHLNRVVSFEANRLKQLETTQSEGIGLRVWQEGRWGLVVAYGDIEPKTLVDKALSLSQVGQQEDPDLASLSPPTWSLPPLTCTPDILMAWAEQGIDHLRQHYPDILCQSEWAIGQEETRILNSCGLDCRFSDASLSGYLGAEWVRGDDLLEVGSAQVISPRLGDLTPEFPVESLEKQVLQRLRWAEKTVDPPTGQVPVIFTAQAADILLSTLAAALNGRAVWQQSSPWSDKQGCAVVSPLLTCQQDPLLGPYGSPFDDEGSPCQPLTLIEQGRLQHFYCDRRTARLLSTVSAGNGFRAGLGSLPTPGVFNVILPPATMSFEQLLATMQCGLVIDQILGDGGGLTGDFSFNLDLGFWVEGGEIVGRVKDTLVAGNAYTALQQVVALGGERQWAGSFYTPAFCIEYLSVTA